MTLKQTQDGKFNLGDKVQTDNPPNFGTVVEIPEWCPDFPVIRFARGDAHRPTSELVKIEKAK